MKRMVALMGLVACLHAGQARAMTREEFDAAIQTAFWSTSTAHGGGLSVEAHDVAMYFAGLLARPSTNSESGEVLLDAEDYVSNYRTALSTVASAHEMPQAIFLDLKGDLGFEQYIRDSDNLWRVIEDVNRFAISEDAKKVPGISSRLLNSSAVEYDFEGKITFRTGEDLTHSFGMAEFRRTILRIMFHGSCGIRLASDPKQKAMLELMRIEGIPPY